MTRLRFLKLKILTFLKYRQDSKFYDVKFTLF